MKHCLIAWLTVPGTSTASSALYVTPEEGVDVSMVNSLYADPTTLANGMATQRGTLAQLPTCHHRRPAYGLSILRSRTLTATVTSDVHVFHRDSFEWPWRDDGK